MEKWILKEQKRTYGQKTRRMYDTESGKKRDGMVGGIG